MWPVSVRGRGIRRGARLPRRNARAGIGRRYVAQRHVVRARVGRDRQAGARVRSPGHAKDGAGAFATPWRRTSWATSTSPGWTRRDRHGCPQGCGRQADDSRYRGEVHGRRGPSQRVDCDRQARVPARGLGHAQQHLALQVSRAPRDITAWDDVGPLHDGKAQNPRAYPGSRCPMRRSSRTVTAISMSRFATA